LAKSSRDCALGPPRLPAGPGRPAQAKIPPFGLARAPQPPPALLAINDKRLPASKCDSLRGRWGKSKVQRQKFKVEGLGPARLKMSAGTRRACYVVQSAG